MFSLITPVLCFLFFLCCPSPAGILGDLIITVIDKTLPRVFSATGKRKSSFKGGDAWATVLWINVICSSNSYSLETLSPEVKLHRSHGMWARWEDVDLCIPSYSVLVICFKHCAYQEGQLLSPTPSPCVPVEGSWSGFIWLYIWGTYI